MPDGYWIDPDAEERILREAERNRRRVSSLAASFPDGTGDRVLALLARHPNISPGLLQASVAERVSDEAVAPLAEQDGGFNLGDIFGAAVDVVTATAQNAADLAYEQAIKPALRGVFTAADTLAQEVVQRPLTAAFAAAQGEASSFGDAYRRYGDSAGLNFLQGQANLGTGFFGEGADERALTIDGQTANVGRAWTSAVLGEVLDPGSQAYNLVAGTVQFATDVLGDPAAWLTGGATKAAQASRVLRASTADDVLRAAGAVTSGRRQTVLIEKAEEFFRDSRLLGELAEADPYTLFQSFNRSAANRIDRHAVLAIGRTSDEAEIAETLLSSVRAGDLTRQGFYRGATFRRRVNDMRFAGLSPSGLVDPNDIDTAIQRVDSMLRQANVERGTRASIFERMAGLEDGDAAGLFDTVTDALTEVGRHVDENVKSDTLAARVREMLRIHDGDREAFTQYGIDELAEPIASPLTKRRVVQQGVDGADVEVLIPTPQISSELSSLAFHLPDAQDIRRAATRSDVLRKVYTSKGWDVTQAGLSSLTRSVFKPLAILRPAYVVRIGLEEQARLSAAGYDSMLSHPFRYLMANLVNREAATDLLGEVSVVQRARAAGAISRDATGLLHDAVQSRPRLYGQLSKSDSEQFVTAWRSELGQLAAAPEAVQLARTRGSLDEFVTWARETSEGQALVGRMAKVSDGAARIATNDGALREWGESVWRRIVAKTSHDEDLLDLVATGKLGDAELWVNEGSLNSALRARLDRAPAYVKVEKAAEDASRLRGHYDRALRFLFDRITDRPTSYLARYPAFRQNMVRNAADLLDTLTDDALRREVVAAARSNLKLTKAESKTLAEAALRAKGSLGSIDNLEDFNGVLVTRSAEQVMDLLFDVTRRSAAQDAFDVALPFLDAWKEVTTTWAGLVKQNPGWFIRAQAGYSSLQGSGVFHVNDFGDEVFTMPGGGVLANALGLGEQGSIELEGRVQGLNLVTQGVGPGFGPVVQWSAGAFLPDSRDFATIREWIAPFGSDVDAPSDLSNPGTYLAGLTPAWMEKVVNAWTGGDLDPVQFNATVGDAMRTLATVGNYQPGNPQDAQRLLADAEKAGRWLLFVRGLAQGVAPTGPSGAWKVAVEGDADAIPTDWDPEADPDARFHTVGVLANEYRRMADALGYELANNRFIELYGVEPFYISQAKTRAVRELPVTEAGDTWVAANRDLVLRHPSVIGYFAPPDDGEFDYAVYRDQIERGDRQSLTPEQQLELANQTKARAIYAAIRSRTDGLSTAARDRARSLTRGMLEEVFPGWQAGVLGVAETANNEDRIDALVRAVEDPGLRELPLHAPLTTYLRIRGMMLEEAAERGYSTLSSDSVGDLRAKLNEAGILLGSRYSAFAPVWQRVLSREVDE